MKVLPIQIAVSDNIEEVHKNTSANTQEMHKLLDKGHSPTTSCSKAPEEEVNC